MTTANRTNPGASHFIAPLTLATFTLLAPPGCQSDYENKDRVDWRDLDFGGYAQNPSASIQIQALDKRTNTWNVVAMAVASATPTTFGEATLYRWTLRDFDFTTVPNAECYWGHDENCVIPVGTAEAKFRFKEAGSGAVHMATFDKGGVACVIEKVVKQGKPWLASAALCASIETPVLTLRMST